ncbi:guanylate kinase [Paenibacillus agricola]|uniref:Guanylate kinase n=1 Tax=Paenibacillus agricola TaxID=2716264 RepID=A0ABX0JC89_9BACL|nr:guanylate kinase [Paenibacillus agricola]NHN32487.1 guanylate kinase [Paenibacillus agricola]
MSISLVIFQGPSASGKSTLQAQLKLPRVITWTSRAPRIGEIDGRDYYFVNSEHMLFLFNNGKMLEMTEYQGHYYGTSMDSIKEVIEEAQPRSIVMDAKGARAIKALYPEKVLLIGVFADKEQCRLRLLSRKIPEEVLSLRMSTYDAEVSELSQCDLVLRNTDDNYDKAELIIKFLGEGLG